VSDVPLATPVTARVGESVADARQRVTAVPYRYLLIVDGDSRPQGWAAESDLTGDGTVTAEMGNPVSPLVNKRTTLKDALSMMLDAAVQTGIVVDRNGAVQGLLTIEAVAHKMREGEHATEFDDLALLAEPSDGADDLDPGAADAAALAGA
jgi:osmoprotectant transport system ATP-binding protein